MWTNLERKKGYTKTRYLFLGEIIKQSFWGWNNVLSGGEFSDPLSRLD